MGWVGKLFGTDKAADNLLDKDNGLLVRAGGWINDLNYTDAEKAENSLIVKEWGIKQLEALTPFKVVQRILAFSTCFAWLFVLINLIVAIWIKAVHPEIDAVTPLKELALSDYVFWPVVMVLSLYTGGGTLNSLRGGK